MTKSAKILVDKVNFREIIIKIGRKIFLADQDSKFYL